MVVLSLFDGMSCGRIALDRAGIKVDKYYASEIDKYAQIVSAANYPDIIRLGDVTKWHEWNIEKPDIIIGGSPCQGFSFAGKGLNFDDPRSKLFFTFVDILKHYKPKYFLLENVKMKKEYEKVISDHMGVDPIEINSARVSAQNRKRLYWTNIPGVTQPEDKRILLKDIIENANTEKSKSYCLDANYYKGSNEKQYKTKNRRQLVFGRMVGRRVDENGVRKDYSEIPAKQWIEPRTDNKSGCLTGVQKDNLILSGYADIKGHDIIRRVYSSEGKAPTLTAIKGGNQEPKIAEKENICFDCCNCGACYTWRKLTPIECERLQTVQDNYTAGVSNSQRYKMLGNGWTVDVIAHIFRGLK